MSYGSLFANPNGRTSRGQFIGAAIPLLLAAALYFFQVKGLTGWWCLVVLLYPTAVLHARRLHDMGQTGWLLLAPGALILAALWLFKTSPGTQLENIASLAAVAVSAAFALWGLVGKGQAETNKFGEPAAA